MLFSIMILAAVSFGNLFFWGLIALMAGYLGFRTWQGRTRFKSYREHLEEEGLLRDQPWVLTRMRFLLLKRITFTRVYLSRRRFVVFHFFTRNLILQAPLGPVGSPGKTGGRFFVERLGARDWLTFETTMQGGGRVRFRVENAPGWLKDIMDN